MPPRTCTIELPQAQISFFRKPGAAGDYYVATSRGPQLFTLSGWKAEQILKRIKGEFPDLKPYLVFGSIHGQTLVGSSLSEILMEYPAMCMDTPELRTYADSLVGKGYNAVAAAAYAELLGRLVSASSRQCYTIESGEREAVYRETLIEMIERLFFASL